MAKLATHTAIMAMDLLKFNLDEAGIMGGSKEPWSSWTLFFLGSSVDNLSRVFGWLDDDVLCIFIGLMEWWGYKARNRCMNFFFITHSEIGWDFSCGEFTEVSDRDHKGLTKKCKVGLNFDERTRTGFQRAQVVEKKWRVWISQTP